MSLNYELNISCFAILSSQQFVLFLSSTILFVSIEWFTFSILCFFTIRLWRGMLQYSFTQLTHNRVESNCVVFSSSFSLFINFFQCWFNLIENNESRKGLRAVFIQNLCWLNFFLQRDAVYDKIEWNGWPLAREKKKRKNKFNVYLNESFTDWAWTVVGCWLFFTHFFWEGKLSYIEAKRRKRNEKNSWKLFSLPTNSYCYFYLELIEKYYYHILCWCTWGWSCFHYR